MDLLKKRYPRISFKLAFFHFLKKKSATSEHFASVGYKSYKTLFTVLLTQDKNENLNEEAAAVVFLRP